MSQIENKNFFSTSGIVTIILLTAFAVTIASMSGGVDVFIFTLLFLGVVMSGSAWFIRKSNRNNQKKNYEAECVYREGSLTADKITIKFDKTKTEINWELFEKTLEVENVIALVNGTDFLGLAEYMFESQADWLQAKEIIHNKYNQGV